VIAALGVLFLTVGLPHSPDGDGMMASIEQPVQLALLAASFVGLVVGGAFAVPAVAFWALWQRARSLRAIVVLAGATAVLLTAG
jgi:hypothetical protein